MVEVGHLIVTHKTQPGKHRVEIEGLWIG